MARGGDEFDGADWLLGQLAGGETPGSGTGQMSTRPPQRVEPPVRQDAPAPRRRGDELDWFSDAPTAPPAASTPPAPTHSAPLAPPAPAPLVPPVPVVDSWADPRAARETPAPAAFPPAAFPPAVVPPAPLPAGLVPPVAAVPAPPAPSAPAPVAATPLDSEAALRDAFRLLSGAPADGRPAPAAPFPAAPAPAEASSATAPADAGNRLPPAWGEAPEPAVSRRARRAAEQAATDAASPFDDAESARLAEAERREAAERRAAEEYAAIQREAAERRAAEEYAALQREAAERRAAEEYAAIQREAAEREAAEREAAEREAVELAARRAEAERLAEREAAERLAAERSAAALRAEAERREAESRAAAEFAAEQRAAAERARVAEEFAAEQRAAAERFAAEQRAAAERFAAAQAAALAELQHPIAAAPPAAFEPETPRSAARGLGMPGADELWAALAEEPAPAAPAWPTAPTPAAAMTPVAPERFDDAVPEAADAAADADTDGLWDLFGGRGQAEIEPPVRRRSYEEPQHEASEPTRALPVLGTGNGWSLGDLDPAEDGADVDSGGEAYFDWGLRPDPEAEDPRALDPDADPWNDPWERDRLEQEPLGSFTAAISVQPDEETGERRVLDRLPAREQPSEPDEPRAWAETFDDVVDDDDPFAHDDDDPFAALFAPTGPTPVLAGAGASAARGAAANGGRGIDPFAGLADDGLGHDVDRYRDARAPRDDRARDDDRGSRGGSGGSGGHGGPGDEGGASVVQVLVWVAVGLVALLILVLLYFFGSQLFGGGDGPETETPSNTTTSESPEPEPTEARAPGETYRWDALFGGECIDPFGSPWDEEFAVVDCAEPHAAQLVYRGTIAADEGAEFPGEETLMQQAGTGCAAEGVVDVNAAAGLADLQMQSTYPVTAEQWDAGVRAFYCFVNRSGGEPITGSLAGPGPAA